ncbi:peptidase M23-like protein [Microterricola gilva]|uniref:Peptidase M23-like protein n=1 Tax=Microterricola gilva TaxID=393267 RepID=A0A4Q8AKL8_9MICO|nr:M23 family metallopeptidase [Microterricola gilva]RZU64948.1 peptidase M23-like protein [Microterricola gilva]
MVHLIKAARGNINTHHGEQIGRGFPHVGIDVGWGGGLELYAPAAGWLTWSEAGTYGNLAVITHDDGTRSRIAHADGYLGFNGRRVEQGEHIGTMGKSGGPWGSSGWFVHCHQEYWVNGRAVNPLDYMTSTAGSGITPIEEDDMYTDKDRERDDITAWRVEQIKNTLDEIALGRGVVNAKLDTALWAVGDPKSGLRTMVAGINGGTATPIDLASIATAVQDEEDRRNRDRLNR